jgi:hypothetical protein
MHVDVGVRSAWGVSLPMRGMARDLRTTAVEDAPAVLDEAVVEAEFDPERRLVTLRSEPAADWTGSLLGARAGGGFRRSLDEVVPRGEGHSLLRQVLDDMPAAALISGYGFMRLARRQGLAPESLTPPNILDRMVDLCSGWRAGGGAMQSVSAGTGVPLQDCPPAPPTLSADPWAFHDTGELVADAMRRRRCLEVARAADGSLSVWAMFRDSVGEPGGGEAVLHEYTVTAEVVGGVVAAIEAEPRVLPFPECPAAAAEVGAVVGVAVADLPAVVPERIQGVACCTHLNDLLRALGGLARLLALVD